MPKKHYLIAFFMIFPLAVGLACLSSAPDPTATPVVNTVIPTQESPALEVQEGPTEEPTQTTAPVATGSLQDLVKPDNSLWLQIEDTVFVSFLLSNPNNDVLFEEVEYTISLYDATGQVLDSSSSTLPQIFPNQTAGIVTNFYLSDESVLVDAVDVGWQHGSTRPSNQAANPFILESANFWSNNDFPMVTGKITNKAAETFSNIRVDILCFGNAGEIVGGGTTYLDFVPGEDYMGFATYVDAFDTVASVQAFPYLTHVTEKYSGNDFWAQISLMDDYFYEGDYGNILGGALIKNETGSVLSNTIFHTTFYDQSGNVTTTGTERIDILLPGSTLGLSPWVFSTPDGAETYEYDILILPGQPKYNFELQENPFVVNSAFVTGDYEEFVTVNFTNTYSKQVSEVDVYVLIYDVNGQIIGGGREWTLEPTPAGAVTEVDVWVDYADSNTIDSLDVWVVPTSWSEFN